MINTRQNREGPSPVSHEWLLSLTGDGDAASPMSDVPTRALVGMELGDGPLLWGELAAEVSAQHIMEVLPEFDGDSAAADLLRRAVEATTLGVLRYVFNDGTTGLWPQVEPADATISYVRRGIPLDVVLRGIRFLQESLTRLLQEEIETLVAVEERSRETRSVTELLFRCFDAFSTEISAFYSLEAERWSHSSAATRTELVTRVLEDGRVDTKRVGAALGYELDTIHVAAVLWIDGVSATTAERLLDSLRARLRGQLGSPPTLVRAAGPSVLHLWFDDRHGRTIQTLESLAANDEIMGNARLAVGERGTGLAGFRASHTQARLAERLARMPTARVGRVVAFSAVRPIALLASDPDQLRMFVQAALGDLAGDDQRRGELRDTLRCYLDFDRSIARTATAMHSHRNTINYRVKQAEGLLPSGSSQTSVQVRLALDVADLLGAAVIG